MGSPFRNRILLKPNAGNLVGYYVLRQNCYVSVGIVKKSDPVGKRFLYRTLLGPVYQAKGIYPICWDGNDDLGNPVDFADALGEYTVHNIIYEWGTAGNTSQQNSGPTLYHSYSGCSAILPVNTDIIMGDLYNEGGSRVAFYCTAANLQARYNILGYGTPNSRNPNSTNSIVQYICSNSKYIFFGGSQSGLGNIVNAVDINDYDNEIDFTSGVVVDIITSRYYKSVIGDRSAGYTITGMCCSEDKLWISYGSQNEIKCYDISGATPSGSLLSTTPGFTNPQEICWNSQWNTVWIMASNFVTNGILHCERDATTGALTSVPLLISDFPTDKITMAIDNVAHVLAVISGGANQNIHLFNIAPQYPTGAKLINILGTAGGMQSTSTVANNRFIFTDNSTGLPFALRKPYLAYDSSSNLFVGDVGNERIIKYDSSLNFVETVQWQPSTYAVGMDINKPDVICAGGLFYEKIAGNWVFNKNYRQFITTDYLTQEQYGVFQNIFTLNIGGVDRRFATIVDISTLPAYRITEWVELTSTGIVYTGQVLNPGASDYLGVIQNYSATELISYRLTSTGWNPGDTPQVKQVIWDFSTGSPVAGSETVVCTFDPIVINECLDTTDGVGALKAILPNGLAIVQNNSIDARFTEHIAAYDTDSGRKVWATFRPTTAWTDDVNLIGYSGQWPNQYYYQRGNGAVNTFFALKAAGYITSVLSNDENFRGLQTNYISWFWKNGLPLLTVGTNRQIADTIEESAPESAGNAISNHFALNPTNSNEATIDHGDESIRSAASVWSFSGLNTIRTYNVPLIQPPTVEPIAGYKILEDVTLNTIIATGGRITRSAAESAGYKLQSGVLSTEQALPDLYQKQDAPSNIGVTNNTDIALNAYNPALASHKLTGQINWYGFNGGESIIIYPEIPPTAMLQILDPTGLIIAEIGLGQGNVFNEFRLKGNNEELLYFTDQNTYVTIIGEWQDFEIVTDITGCQFTYNGITINTDLYNPSADWTAPTTVRQVTRDLATDSTGQDIIATRNLIFEEILTGGVAPEYVSGSTYDATHIDVLFNEPPTTINIAGFSFEVNSVPTTVLGVTLVNGRTGRFEITATLTDTDVITGSYDSSVGNTARGPLELISYTNETIDNTIVPAGAAVIVQTKTDNTGSTSLAYDVNPTPGNYLLGIFDGTIGAFGTSANVSNADPVQQIRDEHIFFGTSLSVFQVYNTSGGPVTWNFSGISSNVNMMILEIANVKNSADPLLQQDGDQGAGNPLTKLLTPAVRALIIAAYANGNGSQYGSMGGGLTQNINSGNNAFGSILSQNAGPVNPAVNVTPDAGNAAVFAAIELI